MSEENTKGLVIKRLRELGYPENQDQKINGVIWYKEDSYTMFDNYLTNCFQNASKSLSGKNKGTPDFTITTDYNDLILVIECKSDINYHQTYDNLEDYKNGLGNQSKIQNYCINGVLHYAQFLNYEKDVVSIAVSGTSENNLRITSFILPKHGTLKDIEILEDGSYNNTIMNIDDYEKAICKKLKRNLKSSEIILSELSAYAIACANYLRANGISSKDRAGFISAIVLSLTNKSSSLYMLTKLSFDTMHTSKGSVFKDLIGNDAIMQLKSALIDIWENKDKLPNKKEEALKEYYDKILVKSLLNKPEGKDKRFFKYGENVLTCCLYSIYENITIILQNKKYSDLDIMGTFYTVFLKYTKGDAKDKGIVLTPKHITELFCDLAEYFLDKPLDDNTKVLDICCGTGGFLIAALNKMDSNINKLYISESEKEEKKEYVRRNCLIGVEFEPEMFALSYANMNFHGDGKSNLYSCSSLIKHRRTNKGVAYKDPITKKCIYLDNELKLKGEIDVGMINPPYSLSSSKKDAQNQQGQTELDFVDSMLSFLKKDGIGIAIVPISCACNKGKMMRKNIFKNHTLLACMSMPKQLFQNSKVGTTTCIMVFKAHRPHNESNKPVFLSRWLDDGFVTIPHNGRYDKNDQWKIIKNEWMKQLQEKTTQDNTVYLKKELSAKDDCVAEAYVKTDYSKLSKENFIKELKRYNLFLYQNSILDAPLDSKELTYWLLDNYEMFSNKYKDSYSNSTDPDLFLDYKNWKEFRLGDEKFFNIQRGTSVYLKNMEDGNIPYVSTTSENNGICAYKNRKNRSGNLITLAYDGSIGEMFYQQDDFFASEKIVTIDIVSARLNKYIAFFLIGIIKLEKFRYDYGRKWTVDNQLKNTIIKLPSDINGNPDYDFMENYIKSLPYSKSI